MRILSGVFEGRTTGTPIGLLIENTDQRSKDYSNIKDTFRPAHADYSYNQKYGFRDYRGGGRSSARETAMRVAAGAIAKKYLAWRYGIQIRGYLAQLGPIVAEALDWDTVETNPFFCPDPAKVAEMEVFMAALNKRGDSIGARINVVATGVMPGLGEPVFDRLDADIAHAMMGINAVKGVEIGAGFASIEQHGSEHRDLLTPAGFVGNNAGGILGGISSGQDITCQHSPQAHLQHPPARRYGGYRWQCHGDVHPRPPRPLRGYPCHPHRRGHAGHRADGPRPAPPRPEHGRAVRHPGAAGCRVALGQLTAGR